MTGQPRTRHHRLALVLALLATFACDLPFGLGSGEEDRLADARRRWERRGFASYDLTLRRVCFCGYVDPVRIEVRAGEKTGVFATMTGDPVPGPEATGFPTVEGLFDIVAHAIDRNAAKLDVRYDPVLGVPLRIDIDYVANAVDDEVTWTIETVTPR